MAYVIAEPCIGTKDTACVDACPVDCIHPKKNTTYEDGRPTFDDVPQLYIDPVECIDCGACVPVCPVSAIFALDDLPEKWKQSITGLDAAPGVAAHHYRAPDYDTLVDSPIIGGSLHIHAGQPHLRIAGHDEPDQVGQRQA